VNTAPDINVLGQSLEERSTPFCNINLVVVGFANTALVPHRLSLCANALKLQSGNE